ncbi:hypothetical protein [Nocardioides nematodiphilus]|uniref:hypothetical protein n=1 Tax=Nocardioides nematodiphilus TaxID=2849669 RepID=UPI001CDA17C4|nr:hypothetical protein [Nocardioides nematodiphilus]MCA1984734.1 hypothetical protein [Nocardioides nematodiphilus]
MRPVIRCFSVNNPHGPEVEDLPLLLRRLADAVEAEGIRPDELMDVTLSNDELIDEGYFCWRATVYWQPNETDNL